MQDAGGVKLSHFEGVKLGVKLIYSEKKSSVGAKEQSEQVEYTINH